MGLFKKSAKGQAPAIQTVPIRNKEVHPFIQMNQNLPLGACATRLYKALRDAVPIIDAAISKTVRLVGGFYVECEDEQIEKQLNDFLQNIKVNACENGIEAFIASFLDQILTYGTAIGEIVLNTQNDEIYALYNACLDDVVLKIAPSNLDLEIYKKLEKGKLALIPSPELVLISALKPEPGSAFGTSILKGLPFVSGILLKIYNTIGINWERVGNVRFAVTYKPGQEAGEKAYAKERARVFASEWQKTMSPGGGVSDFVAVGDVNIKVIGAENQILDSQVPVKQLLEQIISKLGIPPFLLGLSWSTTEKMSAQQADILTSELDFYRRLLTPVINKICNTWLRINGYFTEFNVIWQNINLQDEVEIANARLTAAKAKEIEKRLEKEEYERGICD